MTDSCSVTHRVSMPRTKPQVDSSDPPSPSPDREMSSSDEEEEVD